MISMRLGELRGLRTLRLDFVGKEDADKDFRLQGEAKGTTKRREGQMAVMMLNTEKKILKEMVRGMKALRVFELKGFEDVEFAKRLEIGVRNGWKG